MPPTLHGTPMLPKANAQSPRTAAQAHMPPIAANRKEKIITFNFHKPYRYEKHDVSIWTIGFLVEHGIGPEPDFDEPRQQATIWLAQRL